MRTEDQCCIQHQDIGPIISRKPNVVYRYRNYTCELINGNYIILSNNDCKSDNACIIIPDYQFDQSISSCGNFKIVLDKIEQLSDENTITQILNRVSCNLGLKNNKIDISGAPCDIVITYGSRYMGWLNTISNLFCNSYYVTRRTNNELLVEDKSLATEVNIFMHGYEGKNLRVISLKSQNGFKADVMPRVINNFEVMRIGLKSNDEIYINFTDVDYKFSEIATKYGLDVAIKITGYTAYAIYIVQQFANKFIGNDSNAALFGLIVFMLLSQNLPYLLFLLLKLLRNIRNRNSKHMNDNQNALAYIFMLLVRNWSYIWNVYAIYAIYGIFSTKNVLQYLDAKDVTVLNGFKSILDVDNSFLFLHTAWGYFSLVKILLIFTIMGKQAYSLLMAYIRKTQDKLELERFIMMSVIVFAIMYCVSYSYSIMIIIIVTNIIISVGEMITFYARIKKK